jgi:hypothetical protein
MRRMESHACDLLGGEWLLYWTSRDVLVPRGFLPQLDAWAGIDSRERALSIEPGTPILIDPAGQIDPRLAYFLRRSRFAFLAEESKNAYAKDYRLFFTFLISAKSIGTKPITRTSTTTSRGGADRRTTRAGSGAVSGRGSWRRSSCSTGGPSRSGTSTALRS